MADQRIQCSWDIPDLANLKKRIYALCDQFETVFIYDTCKSQVAANTGKYELLAGLGTRDQLFSRHDSFEKLRQWISDDWVFGGLSYDLKNELEVLSSANPDYLEFPDIYFTIPEYVISIDKEGNKLSIHSFSDPVELYDRIMELSPASPTAISDAIDLTTRTTKEAYLNNIERIREEIRSGNVYEMNYCIQFEGEIPEITSGLDLFGKLIDISPVPFAAYARFSEYEVISASPERYISRTGKKITSQPIKGTRSRSEDPKTDRSNKRGLQNSLKERAENVMIVDLVRNDLARSCSAGTVQVDELFGIYAFPQVFQMISTISGELRDPKDKLGYILSSYPMGSMTGAPKIAAMERIERYENFKRGWYSGSIGYFEPNGNMDMNVLIRSLFINRKTKRIAYGVGGAITIDSEGEDEFDECMWKAKAIRELLGS